MTSHRKSYLKTIALTSLIGIAVIVVSYWLAAVVTSLEGPVLAVGWLVGLLLLATAGGGCVALYRDSLLVRTKRDLFLSLNDCRTEDALIARGLDIGLLVRRMFRAVLAPRRLIVGDRVAIKSFDQILATLDETGCVNGLPFLPEMVQFCGRSAQVFRRVDKIYDYGGKKNLRRLKNAVLLRNMRCDGSAHGGCQASCYLIWNETWLEARTAGAAETVAAAGSPNVDALGPQVILEQNGTTKYRCQFTQLVAASTLLNPRDVRQDLRPLAAGNLTVAGFTVAILTKLFNYAQELRGGIGFPHIPAALLATTPTMSLGLVPGDRVRVRSVDEIGQTLDKNNKNRGLWFDRDMVKHCGHGYTVLNRVERIIDDANGQMRVMKNPCIVLQGISYSGEGLRFGAQQDPTFWREAWLLPVDRKSPDASSSGPVENTLNSSAN